MICVQKQIEGLSMALSVTNLVTYDPLPNVYFDQKWLRTLETLLQLAEQGPFEYINVEPTLGLRYQGDFYGLLMTLRIPRQQHWLIMRLNGYTSPEQYDGSVLLLRRPPYEFLEENMVIFRTSYKSPLQQ